MHINHSSFWECPECQLQIIHGHENALMYPTYDFVMELMFIGAEVKF